jgi:hypothetical protein
MARVPTRVHGPAQVSNAATTKFTNTSGESFILRHVHVYNPGTGTATFTMSIGTDAAGTRLFDAYPVLEDVPLDHWCYYVLTGTETIQALSGTNNQLVLVLDGDRVLLG